jgi:hypothetical protein
LRLLRPKLDFLSPVARGPRRISKTIGKSTQLTEEITKTADISGITSGNHRIRKRKGLSVTLMMERTGARSIVPQDMI